jgi:hypothetical protein
MQLKGLCQVMAEVNPRPRRGYSDAASNLTRVAPCEAGVAPSEADVAPSGADVAMVPHDLEIAGWRMVPHDLGIAGWRLCIVCSVLCAALRLCRWHLSADVAVVGGSVAGGGLNGGYANIDINRDGVEVDGYVVPEAKFPLRLMLETLWDSKWLR